MIILEPVLLYYYDLNEYVLKFFGPLTHVEFVI